MHKLFCFGDGFAANHIWPEWPAILAALYSNIECKNFGVVGAGNEFITSAIIAAHKEDPTAFFIVQWAMPNRFDKLLEDNSWNDIIKNDPVYHFNTTTLNNQKWWISSASRQQDIQQYHTHYIQAKQAELRSINYMYLASNLLKNQSIFFSTTHMQHYSTQDRFNNTRQQEVQPSPFVHICYIEEEILPLIPTQPTTKRFVELKNRIKQQNWIAYDPDRVEIWNKLIDF